MELSKYEAPTIWSLSLSPGQQTVNDLNLVDLDGTGLMSISFAFCENRNYINNQKDRQCVNSVTNLSWNGLILIKTTDIIKIYTQSVRQITIG